MRMDVYEAPLTFVVTLSRRNLLALLHKLDMEGSARTIQCEIGDVALLQVRAEDDAEHYADREPAGDMHPDTERYIATPPNLA